MKSIHNIIKLTVAFLVPVLAACTNDPNGSGDGEFPTEEVWIAFYADDMSPVEVTRSIGDGLDFSLAQPKTRVSPYEEDDSSKFVQSLYILQFTDGILAAVPQYYSTFFGYDIKKEEINGKTQYSVKARLVANPAKTTHIYIVANIYSHNFPWESDYKKYTEARFLADFLSVDYESVISTDHAYLMAGSYRGKVNSNMQIHMNLQRTLSRLRLHLQIAPQLQPRMNFTSAQIKSVHNKVYFFGNQEAIFPEAVESNFLDYFPHLPNPENSGEQIKDGTELAWYVPENRRGTNTQISTQRDKYWYYDPGFVNGRSLSTHLVLKGTYTNAGGDTSIATITLYPGGNVTDDFNVARASSYDMTLSINTFDAVGDNRIVLEEGPFVTYYYYYIDSYTNQYYLGVEHVSGYQVGETIAPGPDVLNRYKYIADDMISGNNNYVAGDGVISDGPSSVDADNLKNIVTIHYYAVYTEN